ncbi:hypothetical protein IFM89_002220 [Coptis chinensis]|uniref:F-box protein n=1 Tax=Coptis chinensis TaxID=261450 RepID=A0A835III4_9MAGN|nr:hypothetical protein IFM89_002220 [Coptis chinensis]
MMELPLTDEGGGNLISSSDGCITKKSVPKSTIHISSPESTNFGFGLNQATNEYKVVRYDGYGDKSDNNKFRSFVSVCTLSREPSWRTIEPFDQYYTILKDRTAPHVNGALHWLAFRIPLLQSRVILSFDLKEDIFKEIPHPHLTELISNDVHFDAVELGGLLCLFGIQLRVELQIWVMKQRVWPWTKQFKIGLLGVYTPSYYFVHGICNGMVLLRSLDNLYIWNPLTRDYIHFRCCPPESTIPLGHSMCLNFGFGLNQATNEYKVVRYVGYRDKSDNNKFRSYVSVCTLTSLSREPSWRTIEPFDQYHTRLKDCTPPLVNGALHWLAIRILLPQSRVILSFDLKEEVFKEIPHPHPTELIFKDVYLELVELGGLLCMFGIQFGVELQIWVMKQYGVNGSWTKQFKIGLLGVCGSLEYLRPVGVANSGEIILIQSSEASSHPNLSVDSIITGHSGSWTAKVCSKMTDKPAGGALHASSGSLSFHLRVIRARVVTRGLNHSGLAQKQM